MKRLFFRFRQSSIYKIQDLIVNLQNGGDELCASLLDEELY